MPAFVAHMFIFEEVLKKLGDNDNYKPLTELLKNNIKLGRLGSIGPDLPYYAGTLTNIINTILSESDKPLKVENWSHQLHAKNPNIFPLKMIEIAWRESELEDELWDDIAEKQWAFIIGFLTHMAADQIIHPYVNKIAKQYYRGLENRQRHRQCEVYHDVVLFNRREGKSITEAELNTWLDIAPGFFADNTEPEFRIFLQKAFIEAHAVTPSEDDIEDWVDGLLTLLRIVDDISQFVDLDEDYQANGEDSDNYREYWLNQNQDGDNLNYEHYFENAIQLALIYAKTAFLMFDINIDDFSDEHRKRFLDIVKNADLTNPLDKNILAEAEKKFNAWVEKLKKDGKLPPDFIP